MTYDNKGDLYILMQYRKNERLIKLRKEKGLTQKNLVDALNMNQSMISCVETGKKEFGKENKVKVANYFGVTVEYLFYELYMNETA